MITSTPAAAASSLAPGAAVPQADPARERFLQRLASLAGPATASEPATAWRLLLAKPQGAEPGLQRVAVRPLLLRGQACLSFVYSHSTKDITQNLAVAPGLAQVASLLGGGFRNAHLHTAADETQLSLSKKGKGHLTVRAWPAAAPAGAEAVTGAAVAAAEAASTHDRQKQRWLSLDRPFLAALGVTTPQHSVVPAMARKWKQINKFIEVFAQALATSPLAGKSDLSVVDFGAGRAYLSFALHDWLRHSQGLQAVVTGVELRPELVQQGQQLITALGLQGMRLQQGDVREWNAEPMDVMIALHACDTATDHAIHLGIRAGAQIILCSPCCHKELRPQLLSPHPLRSVFQHGIHAEQQAEMITDSLRALLLQAQGYETQVFEFVALEHTRKNKIILAVKRGPLRSDVATAALAQVEELKQFFGVREHCLQSLLQDY